MRKTTGNNRQQLAGEVDHNDNLESLIEESGREQTNRLSCNAKDGQQVGTLERADPGKVLWWPQGGSSDPDGWHAANRVDFIFKVGIPNCGANRFRWLPNCDRAQGCLG